MYSDGKEGALGKPGGVKVSFSASGEMDSLLLDSDDTFGFGFGFEWGTNEYERDDTEGDDCWCDSTGIEVEEEFAGGKELEFEQPIRHDDSKKPILTSSDLGLSFSQLFHWPK